MNLLSITPKVYSHESWRKKRVGEELHALYIMAIFGFSNARKSKYFMKDLIFDRKCILGFRYPSKMFMI